MGTALKLAWTPLKYVFLSKDGIKKETVWYGFVGPVYQRLRLYH